MRRKNKNKKQENKIAKLQDEGRFIKKNKYFLSYYSKGLRGFNINGKYFSRDNTPIVCRHLATCQLFFKKPVRLIIMTLFVTHKLFLF